MTSLGEVRGLIEATEAHALARLDALGVTDAEFGLSTGTWLARETGVSGATARSRVEVSKGLAHLGVINEALVDGLISWDHVRVLTEAAANITPEKLARRDPAALSEFGHLFETFVVGEILKQVSWRDDVRDVGHWRTHTGHEVDLVAESQDGSVVGFEIKAGREVDQKALRGLVTLRDALGEQFRAGIFLNTGTEAYRVDDRIYVCPVARLWQNNLSTASSK